MIVINNDKYDEALKAAGDNGESCRINLSADLFRNAAVKIAKIPYLIAIDKDGNDLCVLEWRNSSYVHSYSYTGELDLWFLNHYEIVVLRDCNEYAVELCLKALAEWTGKTIIFVGENWKYIIEELPNINGKECIWEDELADDFAYLFRNEKKILDIRAGSAHEEKMDRYYRNIMTYDEVMTFTFLFSDKRRLGDDNPDKKFFIVEAGYENLGLFTLFHKAVSLAAYAKKKGFIPIFRMKIEWGIQSIYQDFIGDDIWGKFFNQAESYTIEEMLKSQNVYFPPIIYNASIMQNIMDEYSKGTELEWPEGIYNSTICSYLKEKSEIFLPYPEKTLGVLARGTDFVNTHLKNHAIHASMETIGDKIDELLKKWNLEYIFIATEDADYFEYYKKRFGDRVFFTDQERYRTKDGEMLAQMHRRNQQKANGWQLGADYILAVYLLSESNSFLASGGCSGVAEARIMNKKRWANEFVFDLGTNS